MIRTTLQVIKMSNAADNSNLIHNNLEDSTIRTNHKINIILCQTFTLKWSNMNNEHLEITC